MRLVLVSWASIILAAGATSEDRKNDKEELQGTWQVVRHEFEGEQAPKEVSQGTKLTFKGDKYIGKSPERNYEGSFALNPAETPKEIDLQPVEGDRQKLLGIYKLDGDNLTICLGAARQSRPTQFVTSPDSGHTMYVMKRQK